MPRSIELLTFERHKLDEVMAIYPKGHKDFPEGRSVTKLQEINERRAKHGAWFGRIDVGMLNIIGNKGEVVMQLCADPTDSGVPHCDDMMRKLLNDEEWERLCELNRLVLEAEKQHDLPPNTLTIKAVK